MTASEDELSRQLRMIITTDLKVDDIKRQMARYEKRIKRLENIVYDKLQKVE